VQFPALLKIVADNTRHFRLAATRSQEDVAHEAGLTVRAYAAIERGQTPNPSLASLHAIATTLHLDLVDLLTRHDGKPKAAPLKKGRKPRAEGRRRAAR
jgi:transcriptional regulator with XRE-family HTH domain